MTDKSCVDCLYATACPLSGLQLCRHFKPMQDVAILTVNGKTFIKPIVREV